MPSTVVPATLLLGCTWSGIRQLADPPATKIFLLMRRADFLRCVDVIYHQRGVDQNDMDGPTTTNNERRNADEEEMMMWYGEVGSTIYYHIISTLNNISIIYNDNNRYAI